MCMNMLDYEFGKCKMRGSGEEGPGAVRALNEDVSFSHCHTVCMPICEKPAHFPLHTHAQWCPRSPTANDLDIRI